MKSKLAKGIIGNGLAQITLKVIRVLDQLLLVPFFLMSWGDAYYGEWLTLSIIPSILSFSDFGVGSAAGNSFVLAYTVGEQQQAANIRKCGIFVISCTILLGFLLTLAVLFACDYLKLFEKTLIPANDGIIAVLLMMTAKLLMFFHHLLDSYFRCVRKAALGNFIYSGYFALNLLAGFVALFIGCDVVGYAFSQLLVSMLFLPFYFFIANRMIDLNKYSGCLSFFDIKKLLFKGVGYMINMVWQMIYFQGGTFVVRLTLGPESVAVFNTMRTACRSINQIFNIVNGSIFPDMQYEYGKGNMVLVHRMFRLSIFTSCFIGVLGSIFLFLFGMEVYNIWTQNILTVSKEVWYTFVLGILFNGVWWSSIVVYSVTNNPYNFAIPSTIVSFFSIVMSYILSICFNLWGAVLGAVLFDIVMMLYIIPNSSRLIGLKANEIFSHLRDDFLFLKKGIIKDNII